MQQPDNNDNWRDRLHEIIYEADTKAGKIFDLGILILIIFSIILVMLESVEEYDQKYHQFFNIAEWVITILFSIEYILRILCVKKPSSYIFSFFGVIDLLSTIPKYLSIILGGAHHLVALRALRLLRIFRILKLVRYVGEANRLGVAIRRSRIKIFVFIFVVSVLCVIIGTIMYLVEGNDSGFNSIPHGVYWAIVTLTTVGYGDIAPVTGLGQFLASLVMILGYGIIAIPTGIVTAEYTLQNSEVSSNTQSCPNCSADYHRDGAIHCYNCGAKMNGN